MKIQLLIIQVCTNYWVSQNIEQIIRFDALDRGLNLIIILKNMAQIHKLPQQIVKLQEHC